MKINAKSHILALVLKLCILIKVVMHLNYFTKYLVYIPNNSTHTWINKKKLLNIFIYTALIQALSIFYWKKYLNLKL